mgnify:FL=1
MTEPIRFETSLPLTLYRAVSTGPKPEWIVLDSGPGIFHLDPEERYGVRLRTISGADLKQFLKEAQPPAPWKMINLSENRKLSDAVIGQLDQLPYLEHINLSSVDLTGEGLAFLPGLRYLTSLDLSYCNRLSAKSLGVIGKCRSLVRLDLHGCSRLTTRDVKLIERGGLSIHF